MSIRRRVLVLGFVLAAVVGGAAAWAAGRPTHAARHTAARTPSCSPVPRLDRSDAPPSHAMLAALPVLGLARTAADAVPTSASRNLAGSAQGIQLGASRLIATTAAGGRAWVVPETNVYPPLPPQLTAACLGRYLARIGRPPAVRRQFEARLRSQVATVQRLRPAVGVTVVTSGQIDQGGSSTLAQILTGRAFATGECGGPNHQLDTISGLVPAGVAAVYVVAADGTSQQAPISRDAYSLAFTPPAAAASVPERLLLVDASGRTLRTVGIPAGDFGLAPNCSLGAGPPLPALSTIVASGTAPDGSTYTVAAAPGAGPYPCAPQISERSTNGYSFGANLCLPAQPLTVRPSASGCSGGSGMATYQGEISGRVHELRVLLPGGRTIAAAVHPIPSGLEPGAGVFVLFAPPSIDQARWSESLGAGGRVLARVRGNPFGDCFSHPVQNLAPGLIVIARGTTPNRLPYLFGMQRIRFEGRLWLCVNENISQPPGPSTVPQPLSAGAGSQVCPPYPVRAHPPVFPLSMGVGSCKPPRFQIVGGLLLRSGLTAWLRTTSGVRRLAHRAVPVAFRVPGGMYFGIVTDGRGIVLVRDRSGHTVYSQSVVPQAAPGCAGLNPDQIG